MIVLPRRGFTLLELTIGLAVLGLLLVALFQLTNSGTRQVSNQLVAQQMQAYLRAGKSFFVAKRADAAGKLIKFVVGGGNCNDAATAVEMARNSVRDISFDVQCFRQGTLPLTAPSSLGPNDGTYRVLLRRLNEDAGGYAAYNMIVTINGGKDYERTALGQISTYIGAEGAAIYPAGESADDPGTGCDESTATIRGGFGAVCSNLAIYSPVATPLRPATLSYVSAIDTSDKDCCLYRETASPADRNQMTAHLGIIGRGIYFSSAAGAVPNEARDNAITGVTGGIATNGLPTPNAITGMIGGIAITGAAQAAAITGVTGGIQTAGGPIATTGGAISSGGGDVLTGGGNFIAGGGNVTAFDGSFDGTLRALSFIYTGSDRRIKKDIVPLSDQLPQILRIKGVSYVLKASNEKTMGVIAQDVEAVYPELVTEKNGVKMVNYNGLIGPVIEALRELKAENDMLKKRVEVLEQNR